MVEISQHTHNDLFLAKKFIYDQCGFELTEFNAEAESREYGACDFRINGMRVKFRVSKITPAKAGQFVTIWKRDPKGITKPFDLSDGIDFVIISSRSGDSIGQFIFSQAVLLDKGIISGGSKKGKRGIRVYPPWDTVTNKQAEKTQRWQTEYFVKIQQDTSIDVALIKRLFNKFFIS